MLKKITTNTWALLVLPAIVWVFARIWCMEMTNDEAYTFRIVKEMNWHVLLGTANNQWLNSIFIWIFYHLLGHDTWVIRIHSAFSFLVFIYYFLKIVDKYELKIAILIPIALVVYNTYILDFFSLARGYGMGMAFEMGGLYYYLQQSDDRKNRFIMYLFFSLAAFSNYTFMYMLYCIGLLDVIKTLQSNKVKYIFSKNYLYGMLPAIVLNVFAIPNIIYIRFFSYDAEEGQRNGFIADMINVFVSRAYSHIVSEKTAYVWCILLCIIIVVYYVWHKAYKNTNKELLLLIALLMTCYLLCQFFYYVCNVQYYYGRTALFFVMPLLLCFSMVIVAILKALKNNMVLTLVAVTIFVAQVFYNYKYVSPYMMTEPWKLFGTKEAISDLYQLEKDNFKNTKIGMSIDQFGVYENYYRYYNADKYPTTIFVYDRCAYDSLTVDDKAKFKLQTYLLMVQPYEPFLSQQLEGKKYKILKHYPLMESDLLRVE